MLKIFEFQWTSQGEKEWVCAHTIVEALKFYLSLTSMDMVDLEDDDNIIELPKEEWSKMTIRHTDPEEGEPETETFEEFMRGRIRPDIIAGTMYE